MESFGFPKLGNLSILNRDSLYQTNMCINALLKQRQIDIEYRKDAEKRIRNFECENQKLINMIKVLEHRNHEHEKQIETLKIQVKSLDQKIKSEQNKFQQEKEELMKKIIQIASQQTQYQSEIRRREKDIIKLQEQAFFRNLYGK